jgi:hypothetical protein
VCFIGKKRTYKMEEAEAYDERRRNFISHRISLYKSDENPTEKKQENENSWAGDFVARPKEEKLRNCISVDSKTKDKIIHTVFQSLLELGNSGAEWNPGGVFLIHVL